MDNTQVFTPKGKGIFLPQGATAIDFAYKIHSWIGLHAVCAHINGKKMSVKTVLQCGDCVEIDTDENSRPGADWIDHVRTKSAKRHLRSYIQSVLNNEYKRCPHCQPLPGDKVIGFKADDGTITLHKHNCSTAMATQQGEYMPTIEFYVDDHFLYPVRVKVVRRVEHYDYRTDEFKLGNLMIEKLKLWRNRIGAGVTVYICHKPISQIVEYIADFNVHSVNELDSIIKSISAIDGVDEVHRGDIEELVICTTMNNLTETDINRFIEAQEVPYFCGYKQALEEIKNGKKINHWIWYIFPQLRCLRRSSRAHYYGIADRDEAQRYLEHPILGARIREITEALLEHKDKTALSIFGDIDAIKVRSCMTMFDFLSPNDIFGEVLRSFYNEERCEITLRMMQQE